MHPAFLVLALALLVLIVLAVAAGGSSNGTAPAGGSSNGTAPAGGSEPAAEANTMEVFWSDGGRGADSSEPRVVELSEALLIWSDEVRGVQGNFLGLVDAQGRTIQFFCYDVIPDDVYDAGHLRIVELDFPIPAKDGSYSAQVTIGAVPGLMEKAFKVGADHRQFEGVSFSSW